MLLIRFADNRTVILEGKSQAPAAVSRKQIRPAQQRTGYGACVVPSTVAVLGEAQQRYGQLSFPRVLQPALRLAEEGYPVTPLYCRQLKWCRLALRASPGTRRLFLKEGALFKPGEIFRQPILAGTLRRLAQAGPEDFYAGQVARELVEEMSASKGLITLQDLAESARPLEVVPVTATYRGNLVLSAPPPSGGLQVLSALKILEQLPAEDLWREADRWYETLAGVIHAVFREREYWPITPRQLTPSLVRWLLSEEHAAEIFRDLNGWPGEWHDAGEEEEEYGETTHLCVADRQGNVISLSQSLQSLFGAKVASERLGFLYNNSLCTCPRHHHPYQLAGRCWPRSNMAPTVVLRRRTPSAKSVQGQPDPETSSVLALGAAGSRRIVSSIVQVMSSFLDGGLPLAEAVSRARIHVTLSGKVHLEKPVLTPLLQGRLRSRYRELQIRPSHSYFMGAVQAIQTGTDAESQAAADPRREGTATHVSP